MKNNKDKSIYTKNFTGSIDELLEFTQRNAEFVDAVESGKEDFLVNDEEAISMIRQDYPDISYEEAKSILELIKIEMVEESIEKLVNQGLLEIKSYDEDGVPRYGPTELGEEYIKKTGLNDENNSNI